MNNWMIINAMEKEKSRWELESLGVLEWELQFK